MLSEIGACHGRAVARSYWNGLQSVFAHSGEASGGSRHTPYATNRGWSWWIVAAFASRQLLNQK